MAKVNRELIPAVTQVVTPEKEVFHLELSPEEMAFFILLLGSSSSPAGCSNLYDPLLKAFSLDNHHVLDASLSNNFNPLDLRGADIQDIISKRRK
ncbi:hypothetical protein PHB09_163 [Pseudomonas phage PHB09]|uniref:Uncharacterized protein n=1 Tax=Pseudomonas phage PHB09 TaxID=2867265 RepID=A0AAE9BMT5_9CAUD|nr:hypothetical protein QGX10_gp162 [Pseudomonas phage PHB09]UAV84658.1 hypothetical protein PHB09_163 [Pseudomonas phage PHB09]